MPNILITSLIMRFQDLELRMAKTVDASSRPKKHVMFLCQNIQECGYIPTPIAVKMWNYFFIEISDRDTLTFWPRQRKRHHDVRNVVAFLHILTREHRTFAWKDARGFVNTGLSRAILESSM